MAADVVSKDAGDCLPCANDPGGVCLYDTKTFCGGHIVGGEDFRIAALQSLGMLDTPREPVFDAITELLKRVFNTPASHMVLIDPERCWFKSWTGAWAEFEQDNGNYKFVECPREEGWCNYILVPTTAELLVIEDARKDARVSLNTFVVGPPYFRSYVGAPLVGSNGERYGTLCVVDFVPRSYTAEQYAFIINFAALAVEHLEKNKELKESLDEATVETVRRTRHLDLSIQAAKEGVAMLDMRDSGWPIAYCNPHFATASETTFESIRGANFWDFFDVGTRTKTEIGLFIGLGDTFTMKVLRKGTKQAFTIRFLPATSDRLAPSKATGMPAWAPFEGSRPAPTSAATPATTGGYVSATSPAPTDAHVSSTLPTAAPGKSTEMFSDVKCFWFAVIVGMADLFSALTSESLSTIPDGDQSWDDGASSYDAEVSSCGLETYSEYPVPSTLGIFKLGPLIGTGSFGKVYKATNDDLSTVAIKVIDCRRRDDDALDAQLREVQLYRSFDHPHIAKILTYETSADVQEETKINLLWLVLEFCDLGTLTRCLEFGMLRQEPRLDSPPDMRIILQTLHDIASAMDYVQRLGVIHADLTGRNVLLTSSKARDWGFVAKVADFGLSRYTCGTPLATRVLGSITHMPPELLRLKDPLLVPAADVWAFGVIGWETYHGKSCYKGKSAPQIAVSISRKQALPWPDDAPTEYVTLMKKCLAYEHGERLAFSDILSALQTFVALEQK